MDIDKLQDMINESNNIVFFGGAGVSTASGIKDFRGKDGLYTTSRDECPEYMLSSACFYKETDKFYKYYKKNLNVLGIEPNITHIYLKKLEDSGKLKAIVTQNIDGLHRKAGSRNVCEVHGTSYKNRCLKCGKEYDAEYVFKSTGIPKCSCGGTIKPDVTLYGEMLPDDYDKGCYYISNADMLIVAGTSLTVEPASSMVNLFHGRYFVIINDTPTAKDSMADLVIHTDMKDVFSKLKI